MLRELQKKHEKWTDHNFPNATIEEPFTGMVEELGELAHARLKLKQGIRGDVQTHIEEEIDAIGDFMIYLMHYCNLRNFDIEEIVKNTWEKVSERDWIKYPTDGRTS